MAPPGELAGAGRNDFLGRRRHRDGRGRDELAGWRQVPPRLGARAVQVDRLIEVRDFHLGVLPNELAGVHAGAGSLSSQGNS